MAHWPALIVFIAVNVAAAATGAVFRPDEWYERIRKPRWTPPNWLFGPAWTAIYLMIAFSGYLYWVAGQPNPPAGPLALYALTVLFNALWSPLFFGAKRMDLALIDVAAMWLTILATLVAFWPVSPSAAALLMPYLAWVTFASALNATVWRLNTAAQRSGAG